jgi:hypothetical protein
MPVILRDGQPVLINEDDPVLKGEPDNIKQARAAAEAAVRYRRLRALAYRDELGAEEGNFVFTIGDVLDAVLEFIETEATAGRVQLTNEISTILTKRADIKRRIPKSE